MVLHAIDIEQPDLLGKIAPGPGTFETAEGLHATVGFASSGGCINQVARLESNEERISYEEEKIFRLARWVDPMPDI